MRAGDRTNRKRNAHIIGTEDGFLIGLFTQLTKVRIKDFRQLLEDKASKKTLLDLHPVVKKSEAREARRASPDQWKHDAETRTEQV